MRRKNLTNEERREAAKARNKKWRLKNPEKVKASPYKYYAKHPHNKKNLHLRRKYGLVLDDIYQIVELQRGCAICHSPSPRKISRTGGPGEWTVDHDHKTGKVRGIVCHPCNVALGMANDDPTVLRRMADYLEENS